jgi:gamma-glutamyl:cysteine ligase YbdK (ATP-grasp superfamily)
VDSAQVTEEVIEDTTAKDTHDNTELILKTLTQLQRQITGIANEQEKLLKLLQSIKSK